jgi:tetratricopeptide (TPR) repeat protein/energy-coupling factor transporter ATP-binding protein EcfA2
MSQQPYPGLRPFYENEVDIFFGREDQIDEKLIKLEKNHFLMVLGPSGCGKSSLVRTGLFHALKSGWMTTAGSKWRIADFKPGDSPLWNLAVALYSALKLEGTKTESNLSAEFREIADWHAILSDGISGLEEIIDSIELDQDINLVLLADQFEEIFRFRSLVSEDTRYESEEFVALLLEASYQRRLPIFVILTMRTGFLEKCFEFGGLPAAINQSQFLTPILDSDQLRRAILYPAKHFGGSVEPDLVDKMIGDMSHNPDDLPLLQHALMRTWEKAVSRDNPITMTIDDYREIGGLRNALSSHAEEALDIIKNKNPADEVLTRTIFQELTERVDSSSAQEDIRRPRRLKEIAKVANLKKNDWKRIIDIVDVFRDPSRCFITTRYSFGFTGSSEKELFSENTFIDISHESLIRCWDTLQNWVNQEHQKASEYKSLVRKSKEKMGAFLTELQIHHYEKWIDDSKPTEQWAKRYSDANDFDKVKKFISESKISIKEKKKKAKKEQRLIKSLRRFGYISGVITCFLVISSFLVIYVLNYHEFRYGRYKNQADFHFSLKQYDEAIEGYNQAIKVIREKIKTRWTDEDHPEIYISKSRALIAKGNQIATTQSRIWQDIKTNPLNSLTQEQIDLYQEAIHSYQDKYCFDNYHNKIELHILTGDAFLLLEKESEAVEEYKKAIIGSQDPQMANVRIEERVYQIVANYLIYQFDKTDKLDQADKFGQSEGKEKVPYSEIIKNYKEAIALAPRFVGLQIYEKIIIYFQETNDHEQANIYIGKREKYKHDTFEKNKELAFNNARSGNFAEAIGYMKMNMDLIPERINHTHYVFLGENYSKIDRKYDAIDNLKKAIEIAPEQLELSTYILVGQSLYDSSKDEAIKYYKKPIDINHAQLNLDYYTNIGFSLLQQNDAKHAIYFFEIATQRYPDTVYPQIYEILGNEERRNKNHQKAIQFYEKAIKGDNSQGRIDPRTFEYIGHFYLDDRKYSEAQNYYKQALKAANQHETNGFGFNSSVFTRELISQINHKLQKHGLENSYIHLFISKLNDYS